MDELELADWLEGVAQTVHRARRDDLRAAAATIARRYPRGEEAEDREAALAGAVAVFCGEDTLAALTARWREARAGERLAYAALIGARIATPGAAGTRTEPSGLTLLPGGEPDIAP